MTGEERETAEETAEAKRSEPAEKESPIKDPEPEKPSEGPAPADHEEQISEPEFSHETKIDFKDIKSVVPDWIKAEVD